ncbi:MAG: tyrosine--tRNA ligase [Saprospiraceae bacterium]|nr:tyrosine--tRNA ligase [Saprospiraceae bacterium]
MQEKDFISELRWRNMLQDYTPGLEAYLSGGIRRAYIGFDPTARSLGIGNYVQIMLLTQFQRCGHQPVVVMGGATGRIGDPSGKDKERELKSMEELDANIKAQESQLRRLLNFEEGNNKALWVNNYDFYKDMNVLSFLRDVGKNMTINYMMSKESVKKRLETGISFTEFSYQLLQAYDFLCLYQQLDCRLQMGGSDQWGNITSGTEMIGKCVTDAKAFALTTPLLTKSDGKKFGKTEEGNVFLDKEYTSPYKFYQFWLNCDDADLAKLFRYFSLKSEEEILSNEEKFTDDPKALKALLAEEITERIHGQDALTSVQQVSELLFNKNCSHEFIKGLSEESFKQLKSEIPYYPMPKEMKSSQVSVVNLMTENTGSLPSKSEARRAIQANAVSINKIKVNNPDDLVTDESWILGKYLLLENGKKNKFIVELIG